MISRLDVDTRRGAGVRDLGELRQLLLRLVVADLESKRGALVHASARLLPRPSSRTGSERH